MDKNRKCPICGGEFEEGLMLDSGSWGTMIPQQQEWEEGKDLSLRGRKIKVKIYRCKSCGYLESYAK